MKTQLLACSALLLASPFVIAHTDADPNTVSNSTSVTTAPNNDTATNTTTSSTTTHTSTGSAGNMASPQSSSSDAAFMTKLAEGDLAEADAGRLAVRKAKTPAVKEFGEAMAKDHSKNGDDLKAIAASRGVMLPTSVSPEHADASAKLENLNGANFDTQYANGQVSAHKKTVQLLKSEIANGQDQAVKEFATQTLEVVSHHLDMARQLEATVSTSVASK